MDNLYCRVLLSGGLHLWATGGRTRARDMKRKREQGELALRQTLQYSDANHECRDVSPLLAGKEIRHVFFICAYIIQVKVQCVGRKHIENNVHVRPCFLVKSQGTMPIHVLLN